MIGSFRQLKGGEERGGEERGKGGEGRGGEGRGGEGKGGEGRRGEGRGGEGRGREGRGGERRGGEGRGGEGRGGEGRGGEGRGGEGRGGEGREGKIVPCGPIALQVTYVHTKANIYKDTHKHQCATHNVAYLKNLVKRLHVSLPHCQLVHHSPQVSQHRRRVVLLTRRTVGLKHLLSLPQGVLVAIVTVCGQHESPQHGVQRLLIWFWLPT